jgi:hypothetical protein
MPNINPGLKGSFEGDARAADERPATDGFLLRLMGTFRGWILRYALKCATALGAAATGFLMGQASALESLAARMGADHDTLVQLHAAIGDVSEALGFALVTLITGGISTLLSRIAAKTSEGPVIPKAPPVDVEN